MASVHHSLPGAWKNLEALPAIWNRVKMTPRYQAAETAVSQSPQANTPEPQNGMGPKSASGVRCQVKETSTPPRRRGAGGQRLKKLQAKKKERKKLQADQEAE